MRHPTLGFTAWNSQPSEASWMRGEMASKTYKSPIAFFSSSQGVEVVQVEEFKYLGSVIQSNGQCARGGEESGGSVEQVETSVKGDF